MNINCNGKLLDLSIPRVMGILNITDDSFYAKSCVSDQGLLLKVEKMLNDGVDILDIGGQSTRPGSEMVGADDELKRVLPIVEKIKQNFPEAIISVDTFWAKVADECVQAGAAIINDISAWEIDSEMLEVVAKHNVPYVLMHMQGKPLTMQQNPQYNDVTVEVNQFFSEKINQLKEQNINDIILDPGFGFGKSLDHNYELFRNVSQIGFGDYPLLVGISRKSMVYKLLNTKPQEALPGTIALNTFALLNGANILRVHDVKATKDVVIIVEELKEKAVSS